MTKAFFLALSAHFALVGCGSNSIENLSSDAGSADEVFEINDKNLIPTLGLAATLGEVKVKTNTFFKKTTAGSSTLRAEEKCFFKAGSVVNFTATGGQSAKHVQVSIESEECDLTSGYFFLDHVEVNKTPVFSVSTQVDTKFKISTANSSSLSQQQFCVVPRGLKVFLTSAPTADANNHIKVTLKSEELPQCAFRTGYFYGPHLVDDGIVTDDSDFPKVMKHILYYEGGCSDDPNDYGGRTYMGITTGRARQNGWYADVCTMPKDMVLSIYRKDYWLTRPYRYGWPLNLAVMNTEVNSGGGRAQIFLDRMSSNGITGSLVEKAKWYVDQQTDFYHRIVQNDSTQRKFLQGWLNRSAYMQRVISGAISLDSFVQHQTTSAKAYEFEGN